MNKIMLLNFTKFAFFRSLYIFIVMITCFILYLSYKFGYVDIKNAQNFWNDIIDPLLGLATLFIAMLVWWAEAKQDWLASFPNKLTVKFTYKDNITGNDREVMRCERAVLTSKADIRALGQQIGRQMGGGDLKMITPTADIDADSGNLEVNKEDKKDIYRHWIVSFPLIELPKKIIDYNDNEILLWMPPFEGEPERCAFNKQEK